MSRSMRVFIVDDDDAVRDSLQILLESAGYADVRTFASAGAFLASADPKPGDCLLLDVRMPDMDGLELQAALLERSIRIPTIVMTAHGDVPIAVRAMKAGAMDFLEKPFSDDVMLACVQRAWALSHKNDETSQLAAETQARIDNLTGRERDVLDGLILGDPNKIIAYKLGISPRTVEIYRARVMEKMAAESLSALVRMSMIAGYTPKSGG